MSQFKDMNIKLGDLLQLKKCRKVMYKFVDKRGKNNNHLNEGLTDEELKNLNNDFNVTNIQVSTEQFQFVLGVLTESTEQLCNSLKRSNDYYFALV